MKRNIADLPKIIALGKNLGRQLFRQQCPSSHAATADEVLYRESLFYADTPSSSYNCTIDLPRMDMSERVSSILSEAVKATGKSPFRQEPDAWDDTCPFSRKGSMSIRWDGEVTLPAFNAHTHQLH
jgi:hypothetical protein